MANEFVAKNGLISQKNTTVSGSLTVTGSTTSTLGFTGSLFGTASWATNARTASNGFPFTGSAQITGSLIVSGGFIVYNTSPQYKIIDTTVSTLSYSNGNTSVDWASSQLRDLNNDVSINWNDRLLYANDNATAHINWTNPAYISFPSINPTSSIVNVLGLDSNNNLYITASNAIGRDDFVPNSWTGSATSQFAGTASFALSGGSGGGSFVPSSWTGSSTSQFAGTASFVVSSSTSQFAGTASFTVSSSISISSSFLIGQTTVGTNLITQPNPSAIRYMRINANNSISQLTTAQLQEDLGLPVTVVKTANTTTAAGNAGTASQDIPELSFNAAAGALYEVKMVCLYDTTNISTGNRWALSSSVAASVVTYHTRTTVNAGVNGYVNGVSSATTYDGTSTTGTSAFNINGLMILEGFISLPTNGVVNGRFATEVSATSTTCKSGSFIQYRQIS
jgi:hypothetical protein